jgi:exopolyphosphatase/guanosine-5'-triphosphate,3'-diphosphate pyrophosphatase
MRDFHATIQEWQANQIFAFGTSALRNATNAKQVTDAIWNASGISITIIDGEQEAEYIYYGVRTAVPLESEPSLIVDIGGGSVEFIIANATEIFWKKSIEIGAQRLLEQFHKHDPITPEEIKLLENHFNSTLVQVKDKLIQWIPRTLVGSSGTFDTLSEIYALEQGIQIKEFDAETPLTLEAFQKIHTLLIAKNREERMNIRGMIEMRVDMIVVASCLIHYLLEIHPFEKIRVSSYSLKEGVLSQLNSKETN